MAGCLLAGLLLSPDDLSAAEKDAPDSTGGPRVSRFVVDVEASRFTGDFDSDDDIDYDSVTTRLRWDAGRHEFRLTLPVLSLESDGPVVLVGGVPTPGEGSGAGGGNGGGPGPPGGPPGPTLPPDTVDTDVSASGPGDVVARWDAWVLTGTDRRPWVNTLLRLKLPTADEDDGLGTGELDVEAGLGLVQGLTDKMQFLGEVRYAVIGDPPGVDLDDVFRASVGLSRRLGGGPGRFAYAFLENRTHPVPGRGDRLDLMLGVATRFGRARNLRFSGALYAGLSDTAEDWGLQIGFGRQFLRR